jgi:translocation and assembly module TamA
MKRITGGALVAVPLVLCAGCAARRPPVGTEVKAIEFEGNGGFFSGRSDRALRQAMAHPKPSGFWPFRRNVALDETVLDDDRRRIYVQYAHGGYFDAEVVRWRIQEVRPESDQDPPVVKIVGVVREGDQSLVRNVRWEGLDRVSEPLARAIQAEAAIDEGEPFSLEAHQATLQSARDLLHEHAYAHAEVGGTVHVRDSGAVRVTYRVDPGVVARFGEVTLVGGDDVPEFLVRQKLEIEAGDAYRKSDLNRTQQNLWGMGAFAVVEVQPKLDAEPADVVPVRIRLRERAPRSVGLGAGLEAQSGRQEVLGRFTFDHVNALRRLVNIDLEVVGGYAALPDTWLIGNPLEVRGGPIVDASLGVGVPSVPFDRWRTGIELGFEREVTWAYQLNRPSITPSISGPLGEHWLLSLSYWLRYTQYLDLQVDPLQLAALDGSPDLVDGSFVSAYLEQTLIWDTRDNPLQPSRGHRHRITLREAGSWLGGSFDYLGAEAELREYYAMPRRWGGWSEGLVLAGRIGGGVLAPYGPPDRRAVPISERLYLGGTSNVRGWIFQRLGPYVCVLEDGSPCSSAGLDPTSEDADTIPIGGRVSSYGSFEIRKNWDTFGVVGFVDAGMVWSTLDQVGQVPILPSVGLGGRVQTPVGPFRLDVAVRTDDQPRFEQEPRVWFHLGLGEAF